jgi:hypothetical protein
MEATGLMKAFTSEKNDRISVNLTLLILSLPASHLCYNCEIYYLSAVKYDPAATDLIFIRVSIYPGPGKGVDS